MRLYEVGQPVSVVIDPKNIMAYEAKGEGAAP